MISLVVREKLTVDNVRSIAFGSSYATRFLDGLRVLRWVDCPTDVVEELFMQTDERELTRFAAIHSNISEPFIRQVVEAGVDTSNGPRKRANYLFYLCVKSLLANPLFPSDLMWGLYKNLRFRNLTELLTHPNLPSDLMEKVIKVSLSSSRVHLRVMVASNPSLPVPLALKLLGDSELQVHRALVKNFGVDPSLLWPLLGSRNVSVLNSLSKRFEGDERELVLDRLAFVSNSVVARKVVAARTNNEEKMLAAVLGGNSLVLRSVLRNPNLSDEAKVAYELIHVSYG